MMKLTKLSKMLVLALLSCLFMLASCGGTGEQTSSTVVGNNNQYKVSFDYNFDTQESEPSQITVTAGKAYGELPTASVQKDGCYFVGWNTRADGTGDTIDEDTLVKYSVGDHVLYAMWSGNSYTVTYDLGGGNINGITSISSKKVTFGDVYGIYAIPSNPQKHMHKFYGWYTNPTGEGEPVTETSLVREKGDHVLYAVFEPIKFYYDFTDPKELKDFKYYNYKLDYKIVEGENGNYLEISNTSNSPRGYLVLDNNLTAGTTIELDVEFYWGDERFPSDDENVLNPTVGFFCYGADDTGAGIGRGDLGDPNDPSTSQMVRDWYWGQGARNYNNETRWNNGHMKYTVNILEDCQGLQMMMEFGVVKIETDPDTGLDYDSDTSLWHSNKWRINTIKINYVEPKIELPDDTEVELIFDLNYQTDAISPESKTVITGKPIGELPQGLVREGFIFEGWNTSPDGDGVTYNPEDVFVAYSEQTTLYAVWGVEDVANVNYFDFTHPNQAEYFNSYDGLTTEYKTDDRGGYLEVSNLTVLPYGHLVLMKDLKAGTTVDVDLEFIGTVDPVEENNDYKLKAGAFFYGANEHGFNLTEFKLGEPGAPDTPDYINKWYWGQGARNDPWEHSIWNNGHITYTINILEDCYGLNIYLIFGEKKGEGTNKELWQNNKWRINSIVVNVSGIETEYGFDLNGGNVDGETTLDKVYTVTGAPFGNLPSPEKAGYMFMGWYTNPYGTGKPISADSVVTNGKPHTLYAIYKELRLVYDFTTEDQLADFVDIEGDVKLEVVTDATGTYLKVMASKDSPNAHFTLSNIFLKAGSSVEFDVEFVGTYNKSNRAGFFCYGANISGMNITTGALGTPGDPNTPDHVNKWYWGQGYHSNDSSSMWKNGCFTINAQILEDCYGIYVWAQYGTDYVDGYWKITAIRINLA